MLSERSGNKTGPSRSHRVRSLIGPDRLRTLACGSAYAPTSTVKMQLTPSAISSSSVDEVQPASCCWCRCRPAGVTAETTAVDSLYCKSIDQQGDVVRSARVPLLYPCRYAREKLSVRESDRRCPVLAFCPKRIFCLLYTSPSPRDLSTSRMPSSA